MDRAHRLGQSRTVNVYRLLTRGTLEEKIMGLQQFKLDVAAAVVNQDNVSLSAMDGDPRTRSPSVVARVDSYRAVFSNARLIADGADAAELPPLACTTAEENGASAGSTGRPSARPSGPGPGVRAAVPSFEGQRNAVPSFEGQRNAVPFPASVNYAHRSK